MQPIVSEAIRVASYGQKTFCKFLSANDTSPDQSHQAGIYIPKNAYSILFDSPGIKGENKDRTVSVMWNFDSEIHCDVRFIYYGGGTRNEYRMTRTPVFRPEYTGALFVLVQRTYEDYQAYILNTEYEINEFLDAFGLSPSQTNCLIDTGIISPAENENDLIRSFIKELDEQGIEFPNSERMSASARDICDRAYNHVEYIVSNPDQKIIDWTNVEYNLFKSLEYSRYKSVITNGFVSVDDFINAANQVLNRRKSRAGKSLEHHLAAVFSGNHLPFETQVITEGNKKPDFIFPSAAAYHDMSYPAGKLISLAAKTTCKDRWRQVLNEADRLKDDYKYLCTLQQGISINQLDEMKAEKVRLVVPRPYIKMYPKERQIDIWSIGRFVEFVKSIE